MTTATLEAKTTDFDVEDVEYLRHGDKPLLARVYKPRGAGAVSGSGRMPRRRLVPERPPDRSAAPQIHGVPRCRLDRARFPLRQRGPLSGFGAGHQLCGALGQGACPRAEDAARPHRPFRPVERRPSGHAGRHAAARSALCGDRAAGRIGGAGCDRALRGDVVAGDQSAVALSPRQAFAGRRRRMGQAHHSAPRFLLEERSQHGRGQSHAGARARREGAIAAGDLVPKPRRHRARLQGRRIRALPATSRNASSPITKKPAATSRCTMSRWSATPAIRRT